ncbi:MAG: MarR family transcriptional regulator [Sphingomonadales bacterium]|nr:MAG: MarR family transcriptional regulator [Sphingomonadales bacterium]
MQGRGKRMGEQTIPRIGEGQRGEEGHIAYLLRQASASVRHRLECAFGESGITLPQFTMMTILKAYPGITGADLARITLLTPQTVNVITANLLKRGAISRSRAPQDKRAFVLSLSEAGAQDLAVCRAIADRIEEDYVTGFNPQEQAVIRRWLVAVAQKN